MTKKRHPSWDEARFSPDEVLVMLRYAGIPDYQVDRVEGLMELLAKAMAGESIDTVVELTLGEALAQGAASARQAAREATEAMG